MAEAIEGMACFYLWKECRGGKGREIVQWKVGEVETDGDDDPVQGFDYTKMYKKETLTVDYRARAEQCLASAAARLDAARAMVTTSVDSVSPLAARLPYYLPHHYLALTLFCSQNLEGAKLAARAACLALPTRAASWHLLALIVSEADGPREAEQVLAAGWCESVVKRTGEAVVVAGTALEMLEGSVPGRFGWGSVGVGERVEAMRYKITHLLLTRAIHGPAAAVGKLPALFALFKRLFPGFAPQSVAVTRSSNESAGAAPAAHAGAATSASLPPARATANTTVPLTGGTAQPLTVTLSPPDDGTSTDGVTVTVVPATAPSFSGSRPVSVADSYTPAGAPSAFYHFQPYAALLHLWLVAASLYRELGELEQARTCVDEARGVVDVVADREGERLDKQNGVDTYCGGGFDRDGDGRKVERGKGVPAGERVRRCIVDVEVERAWVDLEMRGVAGVAGRSGGGGLEADSDDGTKGTRTTGGAAAFVPPPTKRDPYSRYRSASSRVQSLIDTDSLPRPVDDDVAAVRRLKEDLDSPIIPIAGRSPGIYHPPLLPADLPSPFSTAYSAPFLVPRSIPPSDLTLLRLTSHLHSLALLSPDHVPLLTTL
ncbi:hypothetical protein HDU93_003822, partial [Gonapodya sp. JEL0774]